jgi:hypothetical protein
VSVCVCVCVCVTWVRQDGGAVDRVCPSVRLPHPGCGSEWGWRKWWQSGENATDQGRMWQGSKVSSELCLCRSHDLRLDNTHSRVPLAVPLM